MTINRRLSPFIGILLFSSICFGQIGLWTSAEELADKPMTGLPWDELIAGADAAASADATVSDQDSNNNAQILAAAIVFARTGNDSYRAKVIDACQRLANAGKPDDRTLAWARETGAYALAADLVGYRNAAFETWLRNMAEEYVATDNRTLLYMFKLRPNNWGTQGFGSLCAIYAYLQDTTRLSEVRDYWIQSVTGPKPEDLDYGGPDEDFSWHLDQNDPRLINPKGAVKQGLNIDGIIPDDMRRGTSFTNPPAHTGYAWETLQGLVSGARILQRVGMPIWDVADSAIYRAGYALQVRWENQFGSWKAEEDDLWMLAFLDDAYGTDWAENQPERLWRHGKNAGWPYVVWDGSPVSSNLRYNHVPEQYELEQNFPNPFNPTTQIRFLLPYTAQVHLAVYDLLGEEIATLFEGVHSGGEHTIEWDPGTSKGAALPSGLYLCRLQSGALSKVIKMTMLR
ncbi:FlgD immunoglobulin-like domain containing protein [Candidatus Neomarinimicrobiota bacterium]